MDPGVADAAVSVRGACWPNFKATRLAAACRMFAGKNWITSCSRSSREEKSGASSSIVSSVGLPLQAEMMFEKRWKLSGGPSLKNAIDLMTKESTDFSSSFSSEDMVLDS